MATAGKKARRAPAAKRGAKLNLVKNGPGATDPHKFGKDCKFRCHTEQRGHPTPRGRDPLRIVVDASEGFMPLWGQDVVLRWRFHEDSMPPVSARVERQPDAHQSHADPADAAVP